MRECSAYCRLKARERGERERRKHRILERERQIQGDRDQVTHKIHLSIDQYGR